MFEAVKKAVFPNVFCPIEGTKGNVYNFTLNPKYVKVWPEGYYRFYHLLNDDIDEEIVSINFTLRIRNTENIQDF